MIKKGLLFVFSFVFTTTAIANSSNECLKHIDTHLETMRIDLNLSDCRLNDTNIPEIIDYLAHHPNVKQLILDNNNIGKKGAELLAQQNYVHTIHLDNNHIGEKGAIALAENTHFSQLYFDSNDIGTAGALALAKNNTLSAVSVANNAVATEGIVALAHHPHIMWLDVSGNKLGAESIAAIAQKSNLYNLFISYTDISYEDFLKLASIPTLIALDIKGLHVGDEGALFLAQHTKLQYLNIGDNQISSKGLAALSMLDLFDLDISDNNLRDIDIIYLSQLPFSLVHLILNGNQITDRGAYALANSTSIDIAHLDISYNFLTSTGKDILRQSKNIYDFKADYNK